MKTMMNVQSTKTRIILLELFLVCVFGFTLPSLAQKPDRSKPPTLGPPPTMNIPDAQRFTLSNGLTVVVFEKHQVPVLQLNMTIKSGTVADPTNRIGLASLTAAMLDEGAGSRTALELADAIDYLGASISTGADLHTSSVVLRTPLSKFDSAFQLFTDICLRPTFSVNELDRLRKERLNMLIQAHDQPRTIANMAFSQSVFGATHPYGRNPIGTASSLPEIKIEDIKDFYAKHYRPNNAYLIVVGDISLSTARSMIEKAFLGWSADKTPLVKVPSVGPANKRRILIVDKPEAPQSEIRIGKTGTDRLDPNYFSILVMNTILGGSFSSRLNQNLREQHGYTYGASSRFDFRLTPGPFVASSAVQTEVTDKALTEFMKELNAIREPVSDAELARGKNYLALGYPDNFQSVSQIASQLSDVVFYELPPDYFNRYIPKALAVSKNDVLRAAKKYLELDRLSMIIVGDRKKIEEQIKALKLVSPKDIQFMTIEQAVGKMPTPVIGEEL
jgi:predicted Zn-dependent peptidase